MSDTIPDTNEATDEQCLKALREYLSAKRKIDELVGGLRAMLKRHQSAGIPTKAMLIVAQALRRPPEEVTRELRDVIRISTAARVPILPLDLFPNGVDQLPRVSARARADDDLWTAEDRGYKAGKTSVPQEDNPYQPGSELHVCWEKWWHNGQRAAGVGLPSEGDTVASTSRARPVRDAEAAGPEPGTEASIFEEAKPKRKGGRKAALN